mgnify:CR=1 FL=1
MSQIDIQTESHPQQQQQEEEYDDEEFSGPMPISKLEVCIQHASKTIWNLFLH